MRFIFDLVDGSYVRNTVRGYERCRRTRVLDVPVAALGTAYRALNNIIRDPQCPRLGAADPDTETGGILEEHRLISIETPKRYVDLDLIYRSTPIDGQQQIVWTVTDSHVSDHVLTNQVAGQQGAIILWYKAGTAADVRTKPAGAIEKGVIAHKIVVNRVLRVTGRATRQQWSAVKANIRKAGGTINLDNWGGYPRGDWLFFGPVTHTIDRGNNYDIILEFAQKKGGWFPLEVYRNEQGEIPKDIATERDVRSVGPPVYGYYRANNGIVLASVYDESNFSALFRFSPDEEPQL